MIEGAADWTVPEAARRSHEHEEQCLFFVALSRARTHLRLYLSRFQPSGKIRNPSPFLDWLVPGSFVEATRPALLQADAEPPATPAVIVNQAPDDHLTDGRLTAYDKCPRRFLYTHVLGLGGARKATAFSRTHDCLYELIHWLAEVRGGTEPNLETAEATFETIWQAHGPLDHGFAEDYRRLASRLIAALIRSGAGRQFRKSTPLALDLPSGRVMVEPDEIAEAPSGAVVLRRVRTGYKRKDEYDRLDYTLYHLAGKAHFGANFVVEAVHLTDETIEIVKVTDQKISNRRSTSDSMLADLSAGRFPGKHDAVTCPRCPHYFLCPAIPRGPITLA
jgi:hypothetical protein